MTNPFETVFGKKYDKKVWTEKLKAGYPEFTAGMILGGSSDKEIEQAVRELHDRVGGDIDKVTDEMVLGGTISEEGEGEPRQETADETFTNELLRVVRARRNDVTQRLGESQYMTVVNELKRQYPEAKSTSDIPDEAFDRVIESSMD